MGWCNMAARSDAVDTDVVIVGCGPVGATAANLLGIYGYDTTVIERQEEIHPFPRAVVLEGGIARVFQSAGLIDDIIEHTDPMSIYSFRDSAKRPQFTFNQGDEPGFLSWNMFPQPDLERELRAGFDRFDHVSLQLGHEALDVEQDTKGATTTVKDYATNSTEELRSKYVIGCDGGRSTVRKIVSEEFRDWGYDEDHTWVVVDTHVDNPEDVPDPVGFEEKRYNDRPAAWQWPNPERPFTIVPVAGEHIRFEFALVDGETEVDFKNNTERIHDVVRKHLGDFGFEVFRASVYDLHSIIADRWRDGRIFIAGDAAHQMPPFAGRGMAEGVRDAQNLTWKLNLVMSGRASESLLDSYEEERMPIAEEAVKLSMTLGDMVDVQDRSTSMLHDIGFRILNAIPSVHEVLHDLVPPETPLQSGIHSEDHVGEPREPIAKGPFVRLPASIQESLPAPLRPGGTAAKNRLPQPHIRTGFGEVSMLDDVIGVGRFAVVGWECDPQVMLSESALAYLDQLQTQFVMVTSVEENLERTPETGTVVAHETETKLKEWFNGHDGDVAVVRPDRYVFGLAQTTAVPALVDELRQQLPVSNSAVADQQRSVTNAAKQVSSDGGSFYQ
jgi:3-(3-hydroxy-phenyl)propionate hydroxylase